MGPPVVFIVIVAATRPRRRKAGSLLIQLPAASFGIKKAIARVPEVAVIFATRGKQPGIGILL